MNIGKHPIGAEHPVFVVAELSGNHLHDWQRCLRLAREAHRAGADAVKGQCFTPQSMTLDSADEAHTIEWQGQRRTLFDLYAETAMPLEWHGRLLEACNDLGMEYFASVFSPADCDYMDALGVPCFKIASFELTDVPLIRHVAEKGKPVIISTGMGTDIEWWEAAYPMLGRANVVPLVCTSAYPASLSEMNLSKLRHFAGNAWYGLSDHSQHNIVVSAAVALGACLVERHLTLSRDDGGADAAFSDEPHEFATMVEVVRDTQAALGKIQYGPTDSERPMLRFRRSIWVTHDIAEGEHFTPENVAVLRPEGGLSPAEWPKVIGSTAARPYQRGEPLVW